MNCNLISLRKSLKLSPKEMAERIGVSKSYYYKIEEESRNPSFNFLLKFKQNVNVNIDQIFFK